MLVEHFSLFNFNNFGKKKPECALIIIIKNKIRMFQVESSGELNATYGGKNVEAKIHINNAINVKATIQLYITEMLFLHDVDHWNSFYKKKQVKSFTFIYKKNAVDSSKRKQFAQNSIGSRQKNDALIHFESRNVTNLSRFPSRAFEYSGPEYITYVGFSFNVN